MKQPSEGNVTVEFAGTLAKYSDSAFVLSPCPQSEGILVGNVKL
jgi:hypothetical protein